MTVAGEQNLTPKRLFNYKFKQKVLYLGIIALRGHDER